MGPLSTCNYKWHRNFSSCFNNKTPSAWFLFLPQTHHLPSSSPPYCICVWPRQWLGRLLRETKQSHLVSQALHCPTLPYAAPTLNNTLSRSQSQHCSLLILALCLSLSEELTGHRPFKQHFSSLNLVQWCCFDSIFSEIRQLARLNNSHSSLEWLYLPFLLVLDISCPSKYKNSISNSCLTITPPSHCLVQLTSLATVYRMTVWVNSVAKPF